ncbi:Uncharacterised protein [Mycobacterium tuberculosis]|nr:Uncharacterised protein [Mycobacterium tuberculosis]
MVAEHPVDQSYQPQCIAGGERLIRGLATEACCLECLQVGQIQAGQAHHRGLYQAPGHKGLPHVLVDGNRAFLTQQARVALVGEPSLESFPEGSHVS